MHPIIGNLAIESNKRTQDYLRFGCNAFECQRPISRPLGFWTEQDILTYLYINKINITKCYGNIKYTLDKKNKYKLTGVTRTGCMFCAYGVHLEKEPNKFQKMKITHPKQWYYCIYKLGLGKILKLIGVKYE